MESLFFYLVTAWAGGTLLLLVLATRICYRIEARSPRWSRKGGLPRYAMILPVAFNVGVPNDPQTQAMRWNMIKLLLVMLAGFVAFGTWVSLYGPEEF